MGQTDFQETLDKKKVAYFLWVKYIDKRLLKLKKQQLSNKFNFFLKAIIFTFSLQIIFKI
jgi:hypothetical protein